MTQDITIALQDPADKARERTRTVRLLAAIAADPDKPISTRALAIQTGLLENEVVEIMQSPLFLEVMEGTARNLGVNYLTNGLHMAQSIMGNEKLRPEARIGAFKAIIHAYSVMAKIEPSRLLADDATKLHQALAEIAKENESRRRVPDRADPPTEDEDRGRHRDAG